jgi:Tfp pilus assembly protein PilN
MLRANLSTRPFFNERAVHLLIGMAAVVVLAFSAFNVSRIVSLSSERTAFAASAADAEAAAADLYSAADQTRETLDTTRLAAVSASAREANAIIDRRLFSWTELFKHLESTLPPDVRITSVRPQSDADGATVVTITVIGRRVEDVDAFMLALENTGAFLDVLSRDERNTEEGDLLAVLEGRYRPTPTPTAATDAAAASEEDDGEGVEP